MGLTHCLIVFLKCTTNGWGTHDYVSLLCLHEVSELLQRYGVVIPCSCARTVLFLVIMTELANHVVAGTNHRENLLQAVLCHECGGGQSALGEVCHAYLVVKPACHHLSP